MDRRRFLLRSLAGTGALSLFNSAQIAATHAQVDRRSSGRTFQLEARPSSITIDTSRTAVLVIDMTNDFGEKGGMFERAGIDISLIQKAVAPTARVLAASRRAGVPVIYLKMAFQPDLSDVGPHDSPNYRDHAQVNVGASVRAPNGAPSRIAIRDTWNSEVLAALQPETADIQIYKNRFSGFYATELDATLTRLGARTLIVTGCTTSVCVESTIRDATFRDYRPVLLTDCTAEPIGKELIRSNHEASMLLVEAVFGWTATSEAFVRAAAA
jgi:ureidoacrylate peracid hydrolase